MDKENTKAELIEQAAETIDPKRKKSGRHLSAAEQLAHIAEQKKQLDAKVRVIRARESAKERKARAHRLIQIGGIVEAVYGAAIEGEKMLKVLEVFLREQDQRGNYFSKPLRDAENLQRSQVAAEESLPAVNEN